MARGVGGTGAGFDAAASGKIGGRWRNPSEAEKRLAILKVNRCLCNITNQTTALALSIQSAVSEPLVVQRHTDFAIMSSI